MEFLLLNQNTLRLFYNIIRLYYNVRYNAWNDVLTYDKGILDFDVFLLYSKTYKSIGASIGV